MGGKSGKHNQDDVIISFRESPEIKALAILTAQADGFTNLAEFLVEQIVTRATVNGIMSNRKVTDEFRDRLVATAETIRKERREAQEKIAKRKEAKK